MDKPKLLFVDDRTKRREYAEKEYGLLYEVTCASCVPEALRLMCQREWDVISLDHDLMGHDFEDPDTPTCGMEIVRYIKKTIGNAYHWIRGNAPEFWVHSSNLFAAHLIVVSLMNMDFIATYKPITYKVEHMTYHKDGLPK